jgi:hypothetical protein
LRDCATVIASNTRAPSKASYRAGLALFALDKPDETLDVCARAREATVGNVGFKTLRARAEEKHAEMARKSGGRAKGTRVAGEIRMHVAFVVRPPLPLPRLPLLP